MDYIYEKNNSIDKNLCNKIIEHFEYSHKKSDGCICSGLYKNVKDTIDLHFSNEIELFKEIDKILCDELNNNLYDYINKINSNCHTLKWKNYTDTGFNIQKYIKNSGKYIYHNDERIECHNKKYRILTYLWYLNDIEEGGETEFFGSYKVKPECGKFLLFPASWTFPHCGKIPLSNDKYIITGWIYSEII